MQLSLESEDDLYEFISKGNEASGEFFALMEFLRFECCSTDTMGNLLTLLSEHLWELKRVVVEESLFSADSRDAQRDGKRILFIGDENGRLGSERRDHCLPGEDMRRERARPRRRRCDIVRGIQRYMESDREDGCKKCC
jgi:hypothetical protein